MRKKLYTITGLLLLWQTNTGLANQPLTTQQKQFIMVICEGAKIANKIIYQQRQQILSLYEKFKQHKTLTQDSQKLLQQFASQYKISFSMPMTQKTWQALLTRVDIVPISLTIAQAIYESGWGSSRFASEANNYFGQQCSKPGCGLIPANRPQGKHYEIQKFASRQASINAYMHNLNTHPAYASLRNKRSSLRRQNKPITGRQLADSLLNYSAQGEQYINLIRTAIYSYHLQRYDKLPFNDSTSTYVGDIDAITC